jgi:TonB family protein
MRAVSCVRDFIAKCGLRRALTFAAHLLILTLTLAAACSAQEARKVLERPQPAYPTFARNMSLSGTVKLKAVVTPEGQVKQIEVVGGHPLLVDAAVDAVKRWKYAPSKMETPIELEFHFHP